MGDTVPRFAGFSGINFVSADVLKVKCDALPYRTRFLESTCYFVIDVAADTSSVSNQCSNVLTGAEFAQPSKVPESVWSSLFVDQAVFVDTEQSKGKKKAMCSFDNRFSTPTGLPTSIARETISHGVTKITARMTLPFSARFRERLEPGQTIIVKGVFKSTATYFAINFQSKNMEVISFHFNIRFSDGKVCMNSAGGWVNSYTAAWGPEEAKANPFRQGDPFDIRFRIQEKHIQILVNNMDYYNYAHRVGLHDTRITHLGVGGEAYLTFVQIGEKFNPIPFSTTLSIPAATNTSDDGERTLLHDGYSSIHAMPYLAPLAKLETGQTIIVKGATFADVSQMVINFQTKNAEVIPFHFNPRFNEGRVVMGTAPNWINAQLANWSPAEIKANPIKRGETFDVRIRVHDNYFQINVNGDPYYDYAYKLPLTTITHLYVGGSGYLTHVETGDKYTPIPFEMPGFPVCGKPSCAAQGEMFTSRVQVSDCKALFVSGFASNSGFSIKLYRKNGEIALTFNPRLDLNAVILNSFRTGQWLTEERVNKMPFKKEVAFEIAITNEARGFQILVDGVHLATYGHRTCAYDIAVIETEGISEPAIQI